MILRAVFVWLVLLGVAVINGSLREALLAPNMGIHASHVVSSVVLSLVIILLAWLSIELIGPRDIRAAIIVGTVWLALTVAFEFLAGHYMFGSSWDALLADYDLRAGRTWLLVLMATFLSPLLTFSSRTLMGGPLPHSARGAGDASLEASRR